jgi:2-polyprenyl-3-methyl-5-hydroxy-6-metoxy-1,4-benzoquinol methylase
VDIHNFIRAQFQTLPNTFYNNFDIIILTCGVCSPNEKTNFSENVYKELLSYTYILDNLLPTQKLIYMSSSSVYGDTNNSVSDENSKITINNTYDLGKIYRDNLKSNKMVFGLRLGTVSGILPYTKIKESLINKSVLDAKKNNRVSFFDKNINRSIIGPRDLGRVIKTIIENGCLDNSGVYNINSFNINIEELQSIILEYYPMCEFEYTPENYTPYNFKTTSALFCEKFNFQFIDDINYIITTLITSSVSNTLKKKHNLPKFSINVKCKCCGNNTSDLLDLGQQPLANEYHSINYIPSKYPLKLTYCKLCFHVQLNCTVNPSILFDNYIYVSGTSKTGVEYFDKFAKRVTKEDTKYVLDIACNDGSQLNSFKKIRDEIVTVGIDPAENLYNLSSRQGHDIYIGFFETAYKNLPYNKFDIIIAQNVFAHVDNPRKFLETCKILMDDNTDLYIQTSQANMIANGEFDTAYHEHLSFFNTNSMKVLCEKSGLFLYRVTIENIHGGSYLFHIKRNEQLDHNYNVHDMLFREISCNLYDDRTYLDYNLRCNLYRAEFESTLLKAQLDGYTIIGFGSTAKFNTVLNFTFNKGNCPISYIIDENKLKNDLLTPGCNIPVTTIDSLKNINQNTMIIISAWNYNKEIKSKILNYLKNKGFPIGFNLTFLNVNPIEIEKITLY